MEWNFLFRIDHLNVRGEERNLKGVIFTEDAKTPTAGQIQDFLRSVGYNGVSLKDPRRLIFADANPADPLEITIVKVGNDEEPDHDPILRMLAEQFMKG